MVAYAILNTQAADKKIVIIAGKPSHGPGQHEHRAGCLLFQKCLAGVQGVTTLVHSNGWPQDTSALSGADAVVIYADGGAGHPAIQRDHTQVMANLLKQGTGFGCVHFACEVPKEKGGPEFLNWLGGYYEHLYSVNPMWTPDFNSLPNHPITRGVQNFSIRDEWYFNMRWRPDAQQYDASLRGAVRSKNHLTPILVAKPSDQVRKGPYVWPAGPYDHIVAASGRDETMMWALERADGGRSFGFTGGHFHNNWGNDQFRKIVLNALLWIAKAEVPAGGVPSHLAPEDLEQNLDAKAAK